MAEKKQKYIVTQPNIFVGGKEQPLGTEFSLTATEAARRAGLTTTDGVAAAALKNRREASGAIDQAEFEKLAQQNSDQAEEIARLTSELEDATKPPAK